MIVPAKNRLRIVPVELISRFLGCDPGKLLTSIDHLIREPSAIEIRPGQWISVTALTPPPATKQGKLLIMTRRGGK